jgi:hypothetical protein
VLLLVPQDGRSDVRIHPFVFAHSERFVNIFDASSFALSERSSHYA